MGQRAGQQGAPSAQGCLYKNVRYTGSSAFHWGTEDRVLLLVVILLFGLCFCFVFVLFFANFIPPHKKQCYPEAEEGAQRSMGLLGRPHPLLLLALSQLLLWLPVSNSESEGGAREKFLRAPGGTACRQGAVKDLCHLPASVVCSRGEAGGQDASLPEPPPAAAPAPGHRSLQASSPKAPFLP